MVRRTQAERSDATSARLIDAAQRLFRRGGYAAVSIDAIAAAAGVTKGAAYHHFDGKSALFRAVFVREEEQTAAAVESAAAAEPDGWSALVAGLLTFLQRCLDPGFQRIVMLDGPAVLGWDAARSIEYEHTLRVLREGLRTAAEEGRLIDGDLDARSQLVFGAVCQAGLYLARAEEPARAYDEVVAEALRLLTSLARQGGQVADTP